VIPLLSSELGLFFMPCSGNHSFDWRQLELFLISGDGLTINAKEIRGEAQERP